MTQKINTDRTNAGFYTDFISKKTIRKIIEKQRTVCNTFTCLSLTFFVSDFKRKISTVLKKDHQNLRFLTRDFLETLIYTVCFANFKARYVYKTADKR